MKKVIKVIRRHYFAEPWETELGLTYYGFCKQLEIAFTVIFLTICIPLIISLFYCHI